LDRGSADLPDKWPGFLFFDYVIQLSVLLAAELGQREAPGLVPAGTVSLKYAWGLRAPVGPGKL